jgi:Cu+-exporting ATPase
MAERVKDPVCGMEVEKDTAEGPVEHMGETFYFCSAGCKEKFENEPMKYTENEKKKEGGCCH